MLCTGTAVAEFNEILFKAIGKFFEFIQADFNKNICPADKNSEEVKDRKGENDKRKLERQGRPVTDYNYIFPPSGICPPPERAPVDKLVRWNA